MKKIKHRSSILKIFHFLKNIINEDVSTLKSHFQLDTVKNQKGICTNLKNWVKEGQFLAFETF